MRTGNVTRCSRDTALEYCEKMWCPVCVEWMGQDADDESYSDAFGTVTDWCPNGRCIDCGADMEDEEPEEEEDDG